MISIVSVSGTEVNNDLKTNDTIVVKPRGICSFFIFPIRLKVLLIV